MDPPPLWRRRRWQGGGLAVVAVVLVGAVLLTGPVPAARPQSDATPAVPSGLTVHGNLVEQAGQRYVVRGVTAYLLPFYGDRNGKPDPALQRAANHGYAERDAIFRRMHELGINIVRIPVGLPAVDGDPYRLGGLQGYLDRLDILATSAARANLSVIVGWWDSPNLGSQLPQRLSQFLPMMADVYRRLQHYAWVSYEPFNEPNSITWQQWLTVMQEVLRFWRSELHYRGVLWIDTLGFSWSFSPDYATRLQAFDSTSDPPNQLVFSNHRYAGKESCFCGPELAKWQDRIGRYTGQFAIAGTEYGYWLDKMQDPQPAWNRQLLDYLVTTAIPAGFNGAIEFVWNWVDLNSMTDADGLQLSEHGNLFADHFLEPLRQQHSG